MKQQIPFRIIATFGYDSVGSTRNGEEVIYKCPECINRHGTPDNSGHLFVNTKSLKFFCVRCGYCGVISRRSKISKSVVYDENQEKDLEDTVKEFNEIISDSEDFPFKIPLSKVTESNTATKYLLDRGFTYDQMEYYDMRVGGINQQFGRVVVPNKVNRLVYTDMFSARSYIGQTPKYFNPFDAKKSEIVFNLHRIKEGSPIILVEGVLTAVAAGYHAVASYGKILSKSQASQIISKKPSVIYVNYDYGAESHSNDACKLFYSIDPSIPIMEVLMKDDRDAADLTREEYIKCLENAKQYKPLFSSIESLIS